MSKILPDYVINDDLTAPDANGSFVAINNIFVRAGNNIGAAFSDSDNYALNDGINAASTSRSNAFDVSGTNNVIILTTSNTFNHAPLRRYFAGLKVGFFISATNTGPTTINIDSLGVKNIKTIAGIDFAGGELNSYVELIYNGNNFVLLNQKNTFLIGDYKHSAQNANHNGWLVCNGQAISRATYSALFTVIGTSFGVGDNATTFNLPDARGRVAGVIGQGSGLTNRTLGQGVGEESHTQTINEMPSHNHTAQEPLSPTGGSGGFREAIWKTDGSNTYFNGNSTTLSGGGQPFNVMQPTLFIGNLFIYSGV
jgi:microcystin-dependent protein